MIRSPSFTCLPHWLAVLALAAAALPTQAMPQSDIDTPKALYTATVLTYTVQVLAGRGY